MDAPNWAELIQRLFLIISMSSVRFLGGVNFIDLLQVVPGAAIVTVCPAVDHKGFSIILRPTSESSCELWALTLNVALNFFNQASRYHV